MSKEAIIIGAILAAITAFAFGLRLGGDFSGEEKCNSYIDFLAMLGGWASAIGTAATAGIALHIASKQNEIAAKYKIEQIYDAFIDLKNHMTQKRQHAEHREVVKFYKSVSQAEFYLPQELAGNIKNYFNACFEVAFNREILPDPGHTNTSANTTHFISISTLEPIIAGELRALLKSKQ